MDEEKVDETEDDNDNDDNETHIVADPLTGRERSNANLRPKQWKPGQSGNPAGRKPGQKWSFRAILRNRLKRAYQKSDSVEQAAKIAGIDYELFSTNTTVAELLAEMEIQRALKGQRASYLDIVDRIEGKATSPVDINTSGGVEIMAPTDVDDIMDKLRKVGVVFPGDKPTNG